MTVAVMVGADDHHFRRDLHAGQRLAGDCAGIDITGMRRHHAERPALLGDIGNELIEGPGESRRVLGVELAGNRRGTHHGDLPGQRQITLASM